MMYFFKALLRNVFHSKWMEINISSKRCQSWKGLLRRSVMFQIETDGVLNGHLVFPEHVRMNIKNIGCVYHPRRLVSKFNFLWIYKVKLKGFTVRKIYMARDGKGTWRKIPAFCRKIYRYSACKRSDRIFWFLFFNFFLSKYNGTWLDQVNID